MYRRDVPSRPHWYHVLAYSDAIQDKRRALGSCVISIFQTTTKLSFSRFGILLLIVSALVALCLLAAEALSPNIIGTYRGLHWGCWAFFIQLSVVLFWLAQRATLSKDHDAFQNLFMGSMAFKMLAAAASVAAYFYTVKPHTQLFVLPFICVYFAYTAFEVYFMAKLVD